MIQGQQGINDELLWSGRSRVVARLMLVSVATLCALGLMAAFVALFEHVANTSQTVAPSVGGLSVASYPVTNVPTSELPLLPKMTAAAQRLLVNGQAQVAGGLVLAPGLMPSAPLTGELYYNASTNQPYFYNGSNFISLQPTAAPAGSGSTTIIQQITSNSGAALSGLATNGVVYATGSTSVATLTPSANGALVTDGTGRPLIAQTLPSAVQGNIVSTGMLANGSIAQGFGSISTNNSIATSTTLQGGTGVQTPLLDTASATALNLGTTNATAINLHQNTTIANNKSLTANGSVLFKDAVSSTTAFQVQNASSSNLFTVDAANDNIVLGNDGTPTAVTVRGGAATGTSVAGSNMTFDASNGTGPAGSGALIFRTAGSDIAPITLDNAGESEDYGGPVTINGFTVGGESNMVMVVGVNSQAGSGSPVSSITWNGSSAGWVKVDSEDDPIGNHVELWYLVAPVAGSHNLTVTLSGGYQHMQVGVGTFYNVNQIDPIGTAVKNEGQAGGSPITASLSVPTSSGQLIVDVAGNDQFSFTGVASGQTRIYQDSQSSGQLFGGSCKATSGSTTTMGWQIAADGYWSDIAVPLNPLSGTLPDTLTDRLHISATGAVGIDNSDPQYTLDVAGMARVQTTADSTTAFQIQNASGAALLAADTTNMQVTVTSLVVSTMLTVDGHIVTGGATPGIAAGAAACSTPTVSVAGNDTAGQISVTTGTGCAGAGALANLTFSSAYDAAPRVQITPGSAAAAALLPYQTSTVTGLTLGTANGPADSTTYLFDYLVTQ